MYVPLGFYRRLDLGPPMAYQIECAADSKIPHRCHRQPPPRSGDRFTQRHESSPTVWMYAPNHSVVLTGLQAPTRVYPPPGPPPVHLRWPSVPAAGHRPTRSQKANTRRVKSTLPSTLTFDAALPWSCSYTNLARSAFTEAGVSESVISLPTDSIAAAGRVCNPARARTGAAWHRRHIA